MDMPPAIVCEVTQSQADKALARLRSAYPRVPEGAVATPSPICGLVAIGPVVSGAIGYTDLSGRYLMIGVAFDTHTGTALDGALDGQSSGSKHQE